MSASGTEIAARVDDLRRRYEFDEATTLLAEHPDLAEDEDVLVARGRLQLAMRRDDEALAAFTRAADRAPGREEPAAWTVAALARARRLDEAVETGESALARLPDSPLIRVATGRAMLDANRPAQALEYFEAARRVAPDHLKAHQWHAHGLLNVNRFDDAEACARDLVARHPEEPSAHATLGWVLDDCHDGPGVIQAYEAATALGGLDPRWAVDAMGILRLHGRYGEAERLVEQGLAAFPRHPTVMLEQAWLLSSRDLDDEAAEWARRALTVDEAYPRALVSLINLLRYARRPEEALEAAELAKRRAPRDPWIWRTVAYELSRREEYDQALAAVDHALSLDERDADTLSTRIDILVEAERTEEAVEFAGKALETRPDGINLHQSAATALQRAGRREEALQLLERAQALDPRDPGLAAGRMNLLRWMRRHDEAHEVARRFAGSPEVHMALAELLSAQDRDSEAAEQAEQALELDERHLEALPRRIDFLSYAERPADAVRAADVAIQRRPTTVLILLAASSAYEIAGRAPQALEQVERVLSLDPEQPEALRRRPRLLGAEGRYQEALDAAERAQQALNGDADVCVEMANLCAPRSADDALAWLERALAIDKDQAWALRRRIDVLTDAGRYEEAHRAADLAVERCPEDAAIRLRVGYLLRSEGRLDEALAEIDTALSMDEGFEWAWWDRILVLRDLRRFQEAEQTFTRAREKWPRSADVLLYGAWLMSRQDRDREAADLAARALELDESSEWAARSLIEYLTYINHYDEAERLAAQALERHRHEPAVYVSVAHFHDGRGDPAKALEVLDLALSINPGYEGALWRKIELLVSMRRYDEAEAVAATALGLHPRSVDVLDSVAALLEAQGREHEARARLDEAHAIAPRHLSMLRRRIDLLRHSGRLDEARQAVTDALATHPGEPGLHVCAGWLAYDSQDLGGALACFERAVACWPGYTEGIEGQSFTLRTLRRFDEAERILRTALNRNPEKIDLWTELGRVHDNRLQFDDALSCYDKALGMVAREPAATIARAATLRSLRRWPDAQRELDRARAVHPANWDLQVEQGWLYHDQRLLTEAEQAFTRLLKQAANDRERAAARYSLGWVHYAGGHHVEAADDFRAALKQRPHDSAHRLALAWALVGQSRDDTYQEAQQIAYDVLDRYPEPSAHLCLGVIAFRQGALASAEAHLKKTTEIDPRGSHTDLGALYVQMGRYDEAEEHLLRAVTQDWYDVAAHVELGSLYLIRGGDAEQQFRNALAVDPASGPAAIGYAQALAAAGEKAEAEETLRRTLLRQDVDQRWRIHLALARLLVQRGDDQQNADLHADAYAQAQLAIGTAPESQADPHYVAGVAHHRMGSLLTGAGGRFGYRRRAMRHLRACLKRDPLHVDAQRSLHLLERELRAATPAAWGGYAVASISLTLLAALWTAFLLTDRVTVVLLSAMTPILLGLFLLSALLPNLVRFKLPGLQAELQAGNSAISLGPTGEVMFAPGRLSVVTGPTGLLPRREQSPTR
ncbi:tetratricopeptide repeat protein [Nonomuraea sp. NPDC050536]|uniref:tetratricopeptide repeat protein n=1 Tax=Nonomuraea sp. NPDC050536 TaxID=3364366 RepID=UPI0037C7298D